MAPALGEPPLRSTDRAPLANTRAWWHRRPATGCGQRWQPAYRIRFIASFAPGAMSPAVDAGGPERRCHVVVVEGVMGSGEWRPPVVGTENRHWSGGKAPAALEGIGRAPR